MKLGIVFGILLLSISVLTGAQSSELQFVSQWGGTCLAVDVAGDYVYMGQGPRLVVLDASDPAELKEVGRSDVLPNVIVDLQVVDGYAYLACVSYGLRILSVEDSSNPYEVGWIETEDTAEGLHALGDLVYVADRYGGLTIISIEDKSTPTLVGNLPMEASAEDVAVSGDYAYVATRMGGLRVVSIADPTNPVEVSANEGIETAIEVEISGDTAYVLDQYFGMRAFSISSPTIPVEVGWVEIEHPTNLTIVDELAYVTTSWAGVYVISLADLANLEEVAQVDMRGSTESPIVSNDQLYVANASRGLSVFSISDPIAPTQLAAFDESSFAWWIGVEGDLACVVDYARGLHVLNVADPAQPELLSFLEFAEPKHVEIVGPTAYVCAWYSLELVDLTDPSVPTILGSVELPSWPQQVEIIDDLAYVITSTNGLYVISIEEPIAPAVVGNLPIDGYGVTLDVQDDIAYIGADGLWIISIADPTNPQKLGVLDGDNLSRLVLADNDIVFYTEGSRMYAVSVRDVTNPVEVGRKNFGLATRMDFAGEYLAAGVGWKGVELIDISNVDDMRVIASFDTASRAYSVTVVDNLIYVADEEGGVFILRLVEPENE